MFTNHKEFGGDFGKEIAKNLSKYNELQIASGYFGVSLINKIRQELLDIARRGYCKILIGMIFQEGVSKAQKQILLDLHAELKAINSESGIFLTLQQYHGKVYKFSNGLDEKIYVGSSNLSDSGFYTNYEFNTLVTDSETKQQIGSFLDFLFKQNIISASLDNVELVIKNKRTLNPTRGKKSLKDCVISRRLYPSATPISSNKIKLRVDDQPMSSLNLYFEKGRKDKNGKYAPRPWYEVEITSEKSERVGDYPIGDFIAYYNDGNKFYKIPMITASADNKAITTKDNREILGELIKGKLTRLNHLNVYERVTSETLENYGKDFITLSKIKDGEYYLDF
jgi:HKD family nuclease